MFSHETGTLRCLQKEMATYRHWFVSLWRDPDNVSHCRILSPDKTEWRLISATLCWRRLYFVADQLWLMKRMLREEEKVLCRCWLSSWRAFSCKKYTVWKFSGTHFAIQQLTNVKPMKMWKMALTGCVYTVCNMLDRILCYLLLLRPSFD